MNFLRTISIRSKLWLILIIALGFMVLLEAKAMNNIYQTMFDAEFTAKEDSSRTIVNSGHSLLTHYYDLYQNGAMSEDMASVTRCCSMVKRTLAYWVWSLRATTP